MKKRRCYIYTRVSTSMQVEGYSLEAQKERLRKYADFQEMVIVGEYSDEGKSGKSIEGRQEFMQMLRDIEEGKDRVEFVLVYKLSRFGRNAADVLNSLQRMQDFGVNLICVEDGIDSSKDSGKLMISVLSAVAEIERENILVQTMEGRRQKARDGKWNGGFAPYGYKLLNGELEIAEDEAEIIRIIFDKYIHTNMGVNGIAAYLNEHGYKKKKRQNNTLDAFATSFIKGVLDNPIYCGKLAFGRRKTERVPGKRNEFRIVKQDSYILSDGIHEAIISEDDWNLAKQKRNINGVKHEKIHSLEHEHILSGILKCPICGKGMYGNVNRKKKKDGTFYKDYFYYACKHRYYVNGHKCDYRKQWNEEKVNDAVAEVIKKLVNNPKFEAAIRAKINSKIDTGELETEHENLKKQLRQVLGAKNRLGQQMDNLDISDKMYDRKYQDMQDRLNGLYDEIERLESLIDDIVSRKEYIRQQKISEDGVYQYLLYFDKLYDKFTDMEKKEFMNSFVERVDIYEDEQPNGRFLKHIKFKFPVFFDGEEIQELSWDNETTVESTPGAGSRFTVTLPMQLSETRDQEAAVLAGHTVLVVDDSPDTCEGIQIMLEEVGVHVDWTLDGRSAVEAATSAHLKGQDYFAVILDWKMPQMDGVETARSIRASLGRDIPIILLSAYNWEEVEQEALEAGINGFLTKPIFRSELVQKLRFYIAGSSAKAQEVPDDAGTAGRFDGLRVLVVEDNELNREIAIELLSSAGIWVDSVENGLQAVRKMEQSEEGYYDMIFMDIHMPVMDGFAATKNIRKIPGKGADRIPIIAMTADAFEEDILRCKNAGMNAHIPKPINMERVFEVIRSYWGEESEEVK